MDIPGGGVVWTLASSGDTVGVVAVSQSLHPLEKRGELAGVCRVNPGACRVNDNPSLVRSAEPSSTGTLRCFDHKRGEAVAEAGYKQSDVAVIFCGDRPPIDVCPRRISRSAAWEELDIGTLGRVFMMRTGALPHPCWLVGRRCRRESQGRPSKLLAVAGPQVLQVLAGRVDHH
jgi:hypothetical protein